MPDPKIFISYSRSDQGWAKDFVESLKNLGVDSWLDPYNSQVQIGDSLNDAIEKSFRESDLLVLLLDKNNFDSHYLFFEIGAALAIGKKIIVIVPEDMDRAQLPFPLRLRKYLIKQTPRETAEALVAEVRELQAEGVE